MGPWPQFYSDNDRSLVIFIKVGTHHLSQSQQSQCWGKQRARCCHLIPTPPFRLTPNEAKGVVPNKEFSMAQCC